MTAAALFHAPEAALILDPVDMFAGRLGLRGPRPPAFGPLAVMVEGVVRNGETIPLAPPVRLDLVTTPGGYLLSFNQVTGGDGVVRRPYFPPGRYALGVRSDFYRLLRVPEVEFGGAAPVELRLEPGWRYPFPTAPVIDSGAGVTVLTGAVMDPAGRGIAGAVVACDDALSAYETDATGQFALVFALCWNAGTATVRVTRPHHPEVTVTVTLPQGSITPLPQTRATGRVVTDAGLPVAGATLVAEDGGDGHVVTGPWGDWSWTFPLDQTAGGVRFSIRAPGAARSGPAPHHCAVTVIPQATVTVRDFILSTATSTE